jgi:hypothetical protein
MHKRKRLKVENRLNLQTLLRNKFNSLTSSGFSGNYSHVVTRTFEDSRRAFHAVQIVQNIHLTFQRTDNE